MKIAVLKEPAGETRCAAIPETVKKFIALGADVVLAINGPDPATLTGAEQGTVLVGALDPLKQRASVDGYAAAGIEALAIEWMPRITLSLIHISEPTRLLSI